MFNFTTLASTAPLLTSHGRQHSSAETNKQQACISFHCKCAVHATNITHLQIRKGQSIRNRIHQMFSKSTKWFIKIEPKAKVRGRRKFSLSVCVSVCLSVCCSHSPNGLFHINVTHAYSFLYCLFFNKHIFIFQPQVYKKNYAKEHWLHCHCITHRLLPQ
jgi:hypothetical protein